MGSSLPVGHWTLIGPHLRWSPVVEVRESIVVVVSSSVAISCAISSEVVVVVTWLLVAVGWVLLLLAETVRAK